MRFLKDKNKLCGNGEGAPTGRREGSSGAQGKPGGSEGEGKCRRNGASNRKGEGKGKIGGV